MAAARSARPARAVSAGIRSRAHGEVPAAVPVVPKYARFSGLSATLTSIPSAAPAGIPASITAVRAAPEWSIRAGLGLPCGS